jgi:hypothetical protein
MRTLRRGAAAAPPAGRGTAPVWNRPDTSPYRKVALWLFWATIARLIIPGFFNYGIRLDVDMADETEALFNRVTWLLLFLVSAYLVALRSGAALRLLRAANGPFLALLLFALCSVGWSIDPAASLARLFHVATLLFAAIAAITFGWHPRRYQQVVRPVITFFLLGSLIFGLLAPDLAIQQPVPPETHSFWGGLTIGKNALGAIASAGIILWVHGWASREVKPAYALCGAALSITLLVLSRAATHMMATAVVCGLIVVMLRSSRGMRPFTPYLAS